MRINYLSSYTSIMSTLEKLTFDNLALRRLPIDSEERNFVRTVNGACFSRVQPTPLKNPVLVAHSKPALLLLDITDSDVKRKEFVEYFSGNKLLPGSEPASHCYCGHQFGYFAGQLGDGAAIYLGEVINKKGERWEIQLKGAGRTPYSREADGRKVLRSSIREFLCSEAMHHLGIPTTRAGSCITSESTVIRDMFYDGNPKEEKCSVVLRIAPTFLRFGSFEIFNVRDRATGRCGPSVGRIDIMHKLLDYTIETFYPKVYEQHNSNPQEMYKAFFKEVVLCTAQLVALWQCVGFCHGVLNTDNMSIVGLTIDYGPFGFLDRYDPDHICNSSDDGGRYTYIKQPEICLWNLRKFAEAINMAIPLEETLPYLDLYREEYEKCYMDQMRRKFGLLKKQVDEDKELVVAFMEAMEETGADFTNSFRALSMLKCPGIAEHDKSKEDLKNILLKNCCELEELINANKTNMDARQFQLFLTLMQSNPELLEQLGKGPVAMERVLARIERGKKLKEMTPELKAEQDDKVWTEWLKNYSKRLDLEVEGMEKSDLEAFQEERVKTMNSSNPKVVLRNYLAEMAITKAEKGDFSIVKNLLKALEDPFGLSSDLQISHAFKSLFQKEGTTSCDVNPHSSAEEFTMRPPCWAKGLRVSCSS